jgi:hypothetical protein
MKIKGFAKITAVAEDGTEKVLLDNQQNDICWQAFRHMFIYSSSLELPLRRDAAAEFDGTGTRWKIFYGASDIKSSPLNSWYPNDGSRNVDTDFPVYTAGALVTEPDKMTFRATIPAPVGSSRTINVIGLTMVNSTASSDPVTLTGGNLTILKLTTPCIQATNVTLVITYDLYLYPNQAVSDGRVSSQTYQYIKDLLRYTCDNIGARKTYYGIRDINFTCYNFDNLPTFGTPGMYGNSVANSSGELTSDGMLRAGPLVEVTANAYRYALTFAGVETVGMFIKKAFLHGGTWKTNASDYHVNALLYQGVRASTDTNPVQSVYGQRNSPPGPMQDLTVNNTATMTGYPVFNTSGWTDPSYQKLVRINITGTGNLGTATYNISVMNFVAGFAGNRWLPRTAILPQTLVSDGYFRRESHDEIYETAIDAYSGAITYRGNSAGTAVLAASCLRSKAGVSIYEVLTGKKKTFNSANGLSVSAVSDGEASGGYYYVTCANTGLWRIKEDYTTVEQVTSPTGLNRAYQICKMNDANGTLWVVFDGGLCKLANPSAALGSLTWTVHNETTGTPTFTYAGITNNNWSNVAAMIVNPDNNSVAQFLFLTGTLAGNDSSNYFRKGFVWWDTSTGMAVNPGSSGVYFGGFNNGAASWTLANILYLSDQIRCCGNKWICASSTRLNYSSYTYYFGYGAGNLSQSDISTGTFSRFIPANINNVSGVISCVTFAFGGYIPGIFVSAATLSTLSGSVTLNSSSANVEFSLRAGASSYHTNLETADINYGNLSRVLLYLPGSNMLFTIEENANGYGVTPFVLPPTHSKYNTYKEAFWKDYGWDGANWVLGNAGSKTITGTNEVMSFIDGLGISFANGASGTSFVAGEWFIFAVGDGVFKDNGVTYTCNFSYSMYPTKEIAISGNVPTTALGALTDEPVTFSLMMPNRTSSGFFGAGTPTYAIQNKGIIFSRPGSTGTDSQLIADQLIPASSQFDLRFKWASLAAAGSGTTQIFGLYTGTGTYTSGVHFRFSRGTGVLTVYNNNTLLATVSTPDINGVCRIARDASNNIISYYNGVALHAAVNSTSQFVILADASDNAYGQGWWDMKLSYTEVRRVLRLGSAVGSTGSYSPKFSSLTYSSLPGDVTVNIGSGTPLTAILDYTSAGVALTGTGRVKVCPGAGWLIFHDSEPANPVSGTAVAHFVLNNL